MGDGGAAGGTFPGRCLLGTGFDGAAFLYCFDTYIAELVGVWAYAGI